MNGAPDWQDGECCFRCRTQFTLVARKHHCRNCGNIFCAKCSSQQIPIPKLNIEKNVRVCDGCYDKLSARSDNPLTLALDKTQGNDQANIKPTSVSSSKVDPNAKQAGSASAPSEQELKEEEELQLALALSLSEAPTKISFPDCKQFEESAPTVIPSINNPVERSTTSSSMREQHINQVPTLNVDEAQVYVPYQEKQPSQLQTQNSLEHQVQDRDQELFKFVAEVQSTSEIFNNRISSSKLRNRPIANDTAIQSLFLKLTSMQAKLLEYIKMYDEERAGYEIIHDKLSQIADARAALDALREEHQEKVRQEAAEAERQRQSQLALKLEMMRQKKSQMMQYQREVALQRIQAQEMILRNQQNYQPTATTYVPQQAVELGQKLPPVTAASTDFGYQISNQQSQLPYSVTTPLGIEQSPPCSQPLTQQQTPQVPHFIPQQQHTQLSQSLQQPTTMVPKVDDEAPLISFDE